MKNKNMSVLMDEFKARGGEIRQGRTKYARGYKRSLPKLRENGREAAMEFNSKYYKSGDAEEAK